MVTISESAAIQALDETLEKINDSSARERVLRWAWLKFVTSAKAPDIISDPLSKKRTRKKKADASPGQKKSKPNVALVKDLNLKPSGKKSFKAFVDEKKPDSDGEKCAVAVYYLKSELEIKGVSVGHVLTCYKDAGWRLPTNLPNTLQVTAARKGWLNSSDSNDIQITTLGDNLVVHDLPPKRKK